MASAAQIVAQIGPFPNEEDIALRDSENAMRVTYMRVFRCLAGVRSAKRRHRLTVKEFAVEWGS